MKLASRLACRAMPAGDQAERRAAHKFFFTVDPLRNAGDGSRDFSKRFMQT
jgi:hypothetical protein